VQSPYNAKESLRWLVHLAHPSWIQHAPLNRQPLSANMLAPTSDHRTARIVLFGDLMPFADRRELTVTPSIRKLFQQADLVIGNCETPVAAQTSIKPFVFVMGTDRIRAALEAMGVRQTPERCVLNIANNHAGDHREDGFAETLTQLGSLGVTVAGVQRDGVPFVPTIQVGSAHIAVLGWTEWINRDRFPQGLGICRHEHVDRQIADAREAGADCLLGFPHWDFEFCMFPSGQTVQTARNLLSRGITALIGHHPHVVQPVARYPEGLCIYSLGNATPLPTRTARWPMTVGAVLCLDVVSEGNDVGAIVSYKVVPIRIRRESRRILLSAIAADHPASANEQALIERLFAPSE